MIREAPKIETERCILRAFALSDFEEYFENNLDPVMMEFVGGPNESRAVVWEKFLRSPAYWVLLGYGFWAVERKSDGRQIGQIGFGQFERAIAPRLPDYPEMGWLFISDAMGKGFGSECLSAVLEWGDREIGGTFQCIISPHNAASLALATKFGFVEQRRPDFNGEPIVVLERSESL